eukprot:COSAG05_NODE_6988_length_870_cov_1.428016_1_plen_31_part_10
MRMATRARVRLAGGLLVAMGAAFLVLQPVDL